MSFAQEPRVYFVKVLWGVMGLLLAVPLTAFIKLMADSHPSLCHLSNMLALTPRPTAGWMEYGETALECQSLTCAPSEKSSRRALTIGAREPKVQP
jgi:hypothetical protein